MSTLPIDSYSDWNPYTTEEPMTSIVPMPPISNSSNASNYNANDADTCQIA